MIVVASDALWKNRAVCGKKFTVKCTEPRNGVPHPCTGKSVTMKVIDQCPGCPSTMDLWPSKLLPSQLRVSLTSTT
ncbi:hypothetical protein Goklo_008144, partial [Gossypium klotzschianum]|nr:hypothetical protein [Gossypium klotzschianum]